jgi:hypothetical protein
MLGGLHLCVDLHEVIDTLWVCMRWSAVLKRDQHCVVRARALTSLASACTPGVKLRSREPWKFRPAALQMQTKRSLRVRCEQGSSVQRTGLDLEGGISGIGPKQAKVLQGEQGGASGGGGHARGVMNCRRAFRMLRDQLPGPGRHATMQQRR